MQYYILLFLSTLYKKIASNTIAQIISKALTAIISIFLIGLLTKYLSMEMYGSYNKVFWYLWIFAFLADLWLYTITVREISKRPSKTAHIIWNVLSLRLILWILVCIPAMLIAFMLPAYNSALILIALSITCVFTIMSLLNSALLALMQSQLKMEFSLISLVSGKILNLLLVSVSLLYVFDAFQSDIAFISIFIAALLWVSLNTYMNYLYAQKIVPIKFLFDREYIKEIFNLSLPYGLALFLSVVYFKVDIILLSLIEPIAVSDVSIALYSLPMKIVEVLMVLWGFYLNSVLPWLTNKYEKWDKNWIQKTLWVSLKVLVSFAALIYLLWNVFSHQIISIIATPEYLTPTLHIYNSVQALNISLWVLVFHFVSLVFIYALIAHERQSILLKVNLVVTLINIVWNILLIPIYSFIGAAYITLISQIILMCICSYIVLRDIKIESVYIVWIGKTIAITGILLFFWKNIAMPYWDIVNMIVFVPLFLCAFLFSEYMLSQRLLKTSFSR